MRCRHRLTRRVGSRAGGGILANVTSGGMGVERSLAYHCHCKDACSYPCLKRLDGSSRSLVLGIFVLEVGHDTLGALNSPGGKRLMVGLAYKFNSSRVFVGSE